MSFLLRPGHRPVFALALAGLALGSGCSDDPADPIVLLADASPGSAGSGPGDPGDMCTPCATRADCASGEVCAELDRPSDRFCTRTCGDLTRRCPPDYICAEIYNLSSPACVPVSGQCTGVIP